MLKKILDWIFTIGLAVVLSLVIRTYVAEARWIPSGSMLPTLQIGDRLLVDKAYFKVSGVQRQDIVVFNPPPQAGKSEVMIKRVIGMPGDEVAIRKGIVYVNGEALEEPYELEQPRDDFGPVKVPDDNFLVMGDNRNNSFDSRFWGTVPRKNIIGRAIFRYFPVSEIEVLK
ncbi:MAG: signal peptidase I [Clostridia bacterium]|nr:signal peptidase I [Bacillota bacterium]MDA8212772.1 signal peptidase I [Clostridia bacterium]